ncbi:hypothetical protein [Roseivirga sp. 4D4]|uniref:hypothetical protein n=1 Tax=Roseivirga sp. 4D4 TaxID=1889784 RepID=UPI001112DA57|nr:hypothetical protein [Roseivirga sp. 4D4]
MKVYGLVSTMILMFSMLSVTAQAQEKKLELSVTTGFATKLSINDPLNSEAGNGFHIGANFYKRDAQTWSWDTQLSMNFTSETNSSSDHFTFNSLFGGRYYFSKPENLTRLFFSLLGGIALRSETGDDFTDTFIDVGYSGGLYLERDRFLFGISIDAPQNFIFKLGYTF